MKTIGYLSILAWLAGSSFVVRAQSTAFTYQGRLTDNGSPANGSYDLTATLFGLASGGSPVAGPVTNSAVTVSNGLFTTAIDFGADVFTLSGSNARLLEIAVRPAGAGTFTTLSPRQPITPVPYALKTLGVDGSSLSAPDGSHPNALSVDNTGSVGINAVVRDRPLTINGTGPAAEWISFQVLGTTLWHLNNRNGGWNLAQTGIADGRLFVSSGGNVGVGTDIPGAKLEVRGDIRLGGAGQLRAPGGEENLRIIRGVVNGAGGILVGSGFTATHGAAGSGQYTVTFNTAFSGAPTVTATADLDGRVISTVGVTSGSANFQVRVIPSGVTDAAFHFIAIGPR